MAAAEQVPEPLNYQTVALKVSIHCEGCKREVKRVLHHIEGVYRVSIDLPQHKVVVTGNVAAETLIKKLNKTGKHAELWPEPTPPEGTAGAGAGGRKKKKKKKNKNRNISSDAPPANEPPPQKPEADRTSSDEEENPSEAPGKPEAAPPVPEKQGGAEPAAANGGGGGGRKKKGKKGGHSNGVGGGGNEAEAVAQVEGGGSVSSPAVNISAGKLPTYVVSYSSVQPSMGHGRAYYHDPSPVQQGSSYVYSTASSGSYYIFSEENANACSVM